MRREVTESDDPMKRIPNLCVPIPLKLFGDPEIVPVQGRQKSKQHRGK